MADKVIDPQRIRVAKAAKLIALDSDNDDRFELAFELMLEAIRKNIARSIAENAAKRQAQAAAKPAEQSKPEQAKEEKPVIPPKKELTPKERKKEQDRMLRTHGIDPKKATDAQKSFYGQFIGKTPEEIAKQVSGVIKGADKLDPKLAETMKNVNDLYGLSNGGATVLDSIKDAVIKDGVPYDMLPASHLGMLMDIMVGDKDITKYDKLPAKADICPANEADRATATAMLAYEVVLGHIQPNEITMEGFDISAIQKAVNSIQATCQEKSQELGLDASMDSMDYRSASDVLERAADEATQNRQRERAEAERTAKRDFRAKKDDVEKMSDEELKNFNEAKTASREKWHADRFKADTEAGSRKREARDAEKATVEATNLRQKQTEMMASKDESVSEADFRAELRTDADTMKANRDSMKEKDLLAEALREAAELASENEKASLQAAIDETMQEKEDLKQANREIMRRHLPPQANQEQPRSQQPEPEMGDGGR